MTETTKKRVKAAGIAAAVLTILLLIALMFAVLGVGGYFGKTIERAENISYSQLAQLNLSVPLVKGDFFGPGFTAYPETACLNTSFEKGKTACRAYEYQNAQMYFAVAEQGADIGFDIFAYDNGESVGVSSSLGDIYRARIEGGGAVIYYADKDGVRYALIPFNAANGNAAEQFDRLFAFEA